MRTREALFPLISPRRLVCLSKPNLQSMVFEAAKGFAEIRSFGTVETV